MNLQERLHRNSTWNQHKISQIPDEKKSQSLQMTNANKTHNLEEEYSGLKGQTWWGHQTGKM